MISLPLNLPITTTIIVLTNALNIIVIIIIIIILLYCHELSSIISKCITTINIDIKYVYIVYPDPMSKSMAHSGDTKEAPLPNRQHGTARLRVEMPLGSAVTKTDQQPAEVWTLLAQEVEEVAFG